MNKRKNIPESLKLTTMGFTLVELLAVIVILAIILVIAVPKVMTIIEDSKKATLETTAKMIASAAEKQKVQNTVLGNNDEITCDSVAKINDLDYTGCKVEFDNNGKALVTIIGNGKFKGYNVCKGSKSNSSATEEFCGLVSLTVDLDGGIDTIDYEIKYESGSKVKLEYPTKEGYTFVNWEITPINAGEIIEGNKLIIGTKDIKVKAKWIPNTNTTFVVNHYIEDLNADTYTLESVQSLTGITESNVTPEVKTYEGFTSPEKQSKTIAADGSTVINYYYTRNSYIFTLKNQIGIDTTGSTITGNYEYGETITLNSTLDEEYTFRCWESSDTSLIENVSTQNSIFTMPAGNISMTANVNELYLYNNGVNYTDITGGWTAMGDSTVYDGGKGAIPKVTYNSDSLVVYLNAGHEYAGQIQTNNVLDLTPFKKVTIKYNTSRSGEWSGSHLRIFANDANNSLLGYINTENSSISTASIDLSKINTECYIAVMVGTAGYNTLTSQITIYSIKLEYN